MALNIEGLVVLVICYVLILIVGLVAARWKMKQTPNNLEASLVANRDINVVVGVLTMSATVVGGGFINGSAESIATEGLLWTLAPFGIFIGLIIGGTVYAKPMRERRYLTMLDPIYETSGNSVVFLVYLASLSGDLFWTSSILSALDWNSTSLGASPMDLGISSMVLPHVVNEFTPRAISILGLCAISAAVMSSMDSSILGSASMFTHNIYNPIFRKNASDQELIWVHRGAVFIVGSSATLISLYVNVIYGLFILAADIVYVIVLPQLTCSLFLKRTNAYGAIPGFFVGLILRLGGGEYFLNFDYFIKYPLYDEEFGQLFPFRTFAAVLSTLTIVLISSLMDALFRRGILRQEWDVLSSTRTTNNVYNVSSDVVRQPDGTSYNSKATELSHI